AGVRRVGGALEVTWGGEKAAPELAPPPAGSGAQAIEPPRSRIDKRGLKAGMRVALVGEIAKDFRAELGSRAPPVRLGAGMDAIFFAAEKPADLDRLEALRAKLAPAGAGWGLPRQSGGAGSGGGGGGGGEGA